MNATWLDFKLLSKRKELKKEGIAIVGSKRAGRSNNVFQGEALIIDIDKAKELAKDNPAIAEALSI